MRPSAGSCGERCWECVVSRCQLRGEVIVLHTMSVNDCVVKVVGGAHERCNIDVLGRCGQVK